MADRLTDWLSVWWTDGQTDLRTDGLTGLTGLTAWLTGLTDWTDWTDWLTDWLTGLTYWLTDLTDWIDWLTDWLTDWLIDFLKSIISNDCHEVFIFAFLLLGPSVGPSNVSYAISNKTTFNISWAPLSIEKSHGKVILYDVKEEFLSRGKHQRRSPSNSRTLRTTATFVVLYDLLLCSQYHVSVRAYTQVGPGPYSQPMALETSSEYNQYNCSLYTCKCDTWWSKILEAIVKPSEPHQWNLRTPDNLTEFQHAGCKEFVVGFVVLFT